VAAERQALSAVVADVKGELRRVLEQTEKFHQQALQSRSSTPASV